MKKKLLSIFVMLLMTVTSVLAQQVVETGVIDEFVQTETFNTTGGNDELPYSCQGNGVDINGSRWLSGGLQINYNEMVGITAHSGVKIVKVDLRYGEGSAGSSYTSTTAGELKGKSIVNAYADELTITNSYHHNSGVMVVVDQIKVYYVKVSQSDQEESYSRTSYGTHFAVEGSEYNNGSTKCLNIAYLSKSNPLLCCKPNNWLSFLHCLTIFVPFLPYFALIQARNPLQTRFPRIWKLHKQQEAGSNFY